MKLNWGTRIFILYAGFVLFMLAMVYKTFRTKVDLVTKDYYQQEIKYQGRIEAISNTKKLDEGINYEVSGGSVFIKFPPGHEDAVGTVTLYRPSNKNYDKVFEIALDKNQMLVSIANSPRGLYKMMIDWTLDSTGYYFEDDLYLQP